MPDFVSFSLFGFTSVIKLRNFDFENHCSTLIFFNKKVYDVRFEYAPWKKVWFCFFSIVWIQFSHKTQKFRFWKSLKYFSFPKSKWYQLWICPVKQCLIWFKLLCLSRILAIRWEMRILNFIEIVQYFSIKESDVRSKFVPVFFCLVCIFWHYYRNSFELKMFLMILKHIEIL